MKNKKPIKRIKRLKRKYHKLTSDDLFTDRQGRIIKDNYMAKPGKIAIDDELRFLDGYNEYIKFNSNNYFGN